jgi:branched-subunit amino acid ABC-type transport system permease component
MVNLLQNCLDGLMIGSAYALLGLGFTLIFGVMGRLNLAFGPTLMAGAFLGTWLFVGWGVPAVVVALATVAGAVLAGLYVERVSFRAIGQGAAIASMVSSFALWMQIEEAFALLFPARTYPFPALPDAGLTLGPFYLRAASLLKAAIALLVMAALAVVLYRTRFGLAVRAVAGSPDASRLAGVSNERVMLGAFAMASAVGGVATFLIQATEAQINTHVGLAATYKGLIAMMLGGMGSLPGAVVGGLVLGVLEANAQWYLGPTWREITIYAALFLVLVLRPSGLLGSAQALAGAAHRVR